ncbi:MAG: cbb3-type cytochrome c oxidase subunit 3 [Caulobacter sp.]|nr:cbb3-type cytochrome c oxidase subunit 3 [Caulobacter sp.]
MTYETVARIAQQGGLIYFGLLFLGGCAYALWPKNGDAFVRAARLPLEEEDL